MYQKHWVLPALTTLEYIFGLKYVLTVVKDMVRGSKAFKMMKRHGLWKPNPPNIFILIMISCYSLDIN